MNTKYKLFSLLLSLLLVCGCSGNKKTNEFSHVSIEVPSSDVSSETENTSALQNTYRACLTLDGKLYIPETEISVIWTNDQYTKAVAIGTDGYASTNELDGDFHVHLSALPDGYTYNPNIYAVNNDNPYCEIALIPLSTPTSGTGANNYDKCYKMSSTGTYRATFKNAKVTIVYFEFAPKEAGIYSVESLVDCYDDVVNPSVEIYTGSSSYKRLLETKDDGGTSLKGGYTINFKWQEEFDASNISDNGSAVTAFGIKAESKTGEYPLTIDFTLKYESYYESDKIISHVMYANEANFKTPDFSSTDYTLINTDGGTGNYDGKATPSKTIVLDGSNYAYNEEDGYYHVYDASTKTYGPILVAYITKPCPYYPNDSQSALNVIEYNGNKNLTVSSGTENYKTFIEVDYANASNSDGVCYVTKELKEFLQKFAISQSLFFDGYGRVEAYGRYASEDDQWLFDCAYYKAI